MIELPNNRLILNWHRISNLKQFYEYLSKKFKSEINTFDKLNILKSYKDLKIAIWHAGSFLDKETKTTHDSTINELSKYGEIKQTWF